MGQEKGVKISEKKSTRLYKKKKARETHLAKAEMGNVFERGRYKYWEEYIG